MFWFIFIWHEEILSAKLVHTKLGWCTPLPGEVCTGCTRKIQSISRPAPWPGKCIPTMLMCFFFTFAIFNCPNLILNSFSLSKLAIFITSVCQIISTCTYYIPKRHYQDLFCLLSTIIPPSDLF